MKLIKTAILSTLLSLGIPQAHADQTNVVQNLSVQLWGVQPGGPVTNRAVVTTGVARVKIDTRQLIQALGVATGNSFGTPARLVLVTPLAGGDSAIQVRDGSRSLDVTGFFSHSQLSESVAGSTSNLLSHRAENLDFSIQRFALHDAGGFPSLSLHFDVSGFASETAPAIRSNAGNLELDAAGSGDLGGKLLILRGGVEVWGDRLEVVPGGVGPTT